jgi:predicted nucleic acid-binding protein
MIVVSDTSPLNYLVLIGADQVLPSVFGQVLAPPAVLVEMQHPKAPPQASAWARDPPAWLQVRAPEGVPHFPGLGPGESAAIALAQQCQAAALLMDERDGTAVAQRLGLLVTGTLAVLSLASERGLLSLPAAFAALGKTTFRGPVKLMEELLRIDAARHAAKAKPEADS